MPGPFDLTGQNIENTYQRILQTDGTSIYNGTGSVFTPPAAFPYTGSALITGSLGVTGSIVLSSSNYIRFNNTGSGTNTNYSDLSVYRYPTYDTPALKLIRPDGIGFNLYRQGSTSGVWVGDENGNRNMTMYSNAFGAFTFVAPGSGGDFSFTGGDATTPAYASSIVFKTNDYTINAATSSDHSIKIQGPNVTGSNPYNLVSFQVGSAFTEKAAIRYDGGAYFSSSVSIATGSTEAFLFVKNIQDVSGVGGARTAIFEHRFGVNALSQTQRYGVIVRSADQNMALGITNQTYNTMLQGYNYSTNAYGGISLNPLGGSVSVGRNLTGTTDDSAKFVVRGRGATSATATMLIENTNGSASMVVLDNGNVNMYNSLTVTGSFNSYTTSSAGFLAIVSGSQPVGDVAFNFQKVGEPSTGGRHTMVIEGTGAQDNNIYLGVGQAGGTKGSILSVKGNNSVNINMPFPTGNYGGLAVGGWISGYPSLLVRGFGSTSATTAMRVENTNTSASLVVLDNGFVGINTGSAQYNLDVNGTSAFKGRVNIFGEAELRQDGITQTFSSTLGIFQFRGWSSGGLTAYLNGWNYEGYLNFALNIGSGSVATPSAVLEATSTTRGFRPPRTATTSSISSPAQGLMTYLTGSTNEGLYYFNSGSQTGWHKILTNTGSQSITGSLTVTNASSFSNDLIISSSTTINDQLVINIPETSGPVDDTRPAGFYKATVNGAVVYLPYYL